MAFDKQKIKQVEQIPYLLYLGKWMFFALFIGIFAGSASAFFLISLDWVTQIRTENLWIVWLLPVGGLLIGLLYHYYGSNVVKGNNQLLEEFHSPKQIIPFRMAPLVLFGTLVTHLFGGSAGREGTAVQMGGAISDQFTLLFKLKHRDRQVLIIMGISAGFASVFGTPLAGAIFALEVLTVGRMRYDAILPSLLAAIMGDLICRLWDVGHTQYAIPSVPELQGYSLIYAAFAGILFGLTALLFSKSTAFFTRKFTHFITYPPFRPLVGGLLLAIIFLVGGQTDYMGLGLPTIEASFTEKQLPQTFLLKLLFTAFTLGAGFKGGEVTPLFFIGATLGNVLALFIPLPMALLAGMGFVAVFAGATNTPIACIFMGMELFGAESGVFIAIACVVAYIFSGHNGIYGSQMIGSPKHLAYGRYSQKTIKEVGPQKQS
jgi:H+/Cl- antiporter ClcA